MPSFLMYLSSQLMIPQDTSAQSLPGAQEYSLSAAPCRALKEISSPRQVGFSVAPQGAAFRSSSREEGNGG